MNVVSHRTNPAMRASPAIPSPVRTPGSARSRDAVADGELPGGDAADLDLVPPGPVGVEGGDGASGAVEGLVDHLSLVRVDFDGECRRDRDDDREVVEPDVVVAFEVDDSSVSLVELHGHGARNRDAVEGVDVALRVPVAAQRRGQRR